MLTRTILPETYREAPDDPSRIAVTLLWFFIWLIFNIIGDNEPLTFDPVNWWAGTLMLAVAVDLGRQHTGDLGKLSRAR